MPTPSPQTADESTVEIDLKDPRLAAFLAWLIPGAGHLYQGRTGKGILFLVCILGTFFYGLYIGGGRVVYASTSPFFSQPANAAPAGRLRWLGFITDRWQYICQAGVGLPAMPALVQRARIRGHKPPIISEKLMRPPYDFNYPPPDGDRVTYLTSKDQTDPNHTVEHADELAKWNYDYGEYFDIGTMFTVIAGLLNVLVIFDAYGGPLIIVPPDDQKAKAQP